MDVLANPKRRIRGSPDRTTSALGSCRSEGLPTAFHPADRPYTRNSLSLSLSAGGKLPDTVTDPEWAKATAERYKSWDREGAPDRPIRLNPIKGKNFP
jgi:hypothetical protein